MAVNHNRITLWTSSKWKAITQYLMLRKDPLMKNQTSQDSQEIKY